MSSTIVTTNPGDMLCVDIVRRITSGLAKMPACIEVGLASSSTSFFFLSLPLGVSAAVLFSDCLGKGLFKRSYN